VGKIARAVSVPFLASIHCDYLGFWEKFLGESWFVYLPPESDIVGTLIVSAAA
jgi:hypothetical protein